MDLYSYVFVSSNDCDDVVEVLILIDWGFLDKFFFLFDRGCVWCEMDDDRLPSWID
jgi:hypothetical protein